MQLSSNKNPSYHRYWPVVKECVYECVCGSHCVPEHVGLNFVKVGR